MIDLTGQSAIVTGASRGIGAETARALAAAGASVVLAARTLDEIEAIAAEITRAGGRAEALRCDVSDYADMTTAVERAVAMTGEIDILINNAGVIDPIGHLADSDPVAWKQAASINYFGVYNGMRAAMPRMIAAGTGTIVTVSSGAAHRPLEGWSHYCSAKAAVAMLTRMVHAEAGPAGVNAIGLSPGTVATYMQRAIKASGLNPVSTLEWSDHIPPDWPARAILWLCGPEAAAFAGEEVALGDETFRARIGLA